MVNPTNYSVYLNKAFWWWQITVRKIFHEVISVSYGERQTIFATLILIVSPEIKKLFILPKLYSFLVLDHSIL